MRLISLFLLLTFFLASCAEAPKEGPERLVLEKASFSDLDGWERDHVSDALPALLKSCKALGKKQDWKDMCAEVGSLEAHNDEIARRFFVKWFSVYAAKGRDGAEGLFTGYYEAELRGSWKRGGDYQTPLYMRPDDLIDVDLGLFKSELQGQHIEGKIEGSKLTPYDARAEIEKGSLFGRTQVLMWVDDPVDAFFLAIQGSGRVQMSDGSVVRVGYDHANGRAYVAIGRVLADRGDLQKPVTMTSIRVWLKRHPDHAAEVMNQNPSYVFFRLLDAAANDGPVGAEGVALTPGRSLAVDPALMTLGAPVWLDTTDGKGGVLQRLVMAQDTGGAIKGAVRGDVFWGFGPEAEVQAGSMQSKGRYFVLLPKTMTPHAVR